MNKLWMVTASVALASGALFMPRMLRAQNVSVQTTAGPYTVTLKVLPAESFTGPHAAMAREGGAQPNDVGASTHVNHHLVAFVTENGNPVEHAEVKIRYRELSPRSGPWLSEPVVIMQVAGKGPSTTHYGNNVEMDPGHYAARVSVNGKAEASFKFTLSAQGSSSGSGSIG